MRIVLSLNVFEHFLPSSSSLFSPREKRSLSPLRASSHCWAYRWENYCRCRHALLPVWKSPYLVQIQGHTFVISGLMTPAWCTCFPEFQNIWRIGVHLLWSLRSVLSQGEEFVELRTLEIAYYFSLFTDNSCLISMNWIILYISHKILIISSKLKISYKFFKNWYSYNCFIHFWAIRTVFVILHHRSIKSGKRPIYWAYWDNMHLLVDPG